MSKTKGKRRIWETEQEYNITGRADRTPVPVPGEHLFVVELTFQVEPFPEGGTWFMDIENLISKIGPVCRWCRAEVDLDAFIDPCPGLPG